MLKSLLILAALAIGTLLPGLASYTFTIRPFLMVLLFFSFLKVRLSREIFRREQLYFCLLLPLISLMAYKLGTLYDPYLAYMLLLMGVAPTAIISPVLADLMRRDAGYLIGSIIVTHLMMALAVPFLIPWVLGINPSISELGNLFATIGSTIFVPLLLAQLVKSIGGNFLRSLSWLGPKSFILFLSNLVIAAGSLSAYLRQSTEISIDFVLITLLAIVVLLLLNFAAGTWLSSPGHWVEGSLSMGRKNTMLSIWIALEYISPLVVLGPMLYIIAQNILVSGQIIWVERRDREKKLESIPPQS